MTDDNRPTALPTPRREQVIGDGIAWTAKWSLRWVLIALGVVLLGLVIGELWSVLLPVVLALILTTVLQPPAHFLQHRLHLSSTLAAAITLLGTIAIVALIGFLIAPSVGSQSADIARDASSGLTKVQDWLSKSDLVTGRQIDTVVNAAQDKLTSSASSIASGVLVGVGAITNALINLLVTLILALFFLKDGHKFAPWLRSLTGSRVGPHLVEVAGRSWATLGGFIRTQALVSLIDAVLIGAALVVVQVPLAIPLAILTFAGGFIPIIGAVTVGAIAVLVALVSQGLTQALIILAVIVLVQQLEGNVLSPILQSRSSELHPGIVLLAITLGSTLFGIIGAFLAVPVVSTLAAIFRYLNELVAARSAEESERGESLPQAGQEHPNAPEGSEDSTGRKRLRISKAARQNRTSEA